MRLRKMGAQIVAPDSWASPAVITLALPSGLRSESVGRQLEQAGYILNYRSDYLRARNWIQICPLSPVSRGDLEGLLGTLQGYLVASRQGPRSRPVHTADA